ncbi:MAG: hypothetical protein ACI8PT_002008 [Gammaproteobacteria bacterium]|jgi:hypothetical protein
MPLSRSRIEFDLAPGTLAPQRRTTKHRAGAAGNFDPYANHAGEGTVPVIPRQPSAVSSGSGFGGGNLLTGATFDTINISGTSA